MTPRHWWQFWRRLRRGPALTVRIYLSDGTEVDLTRTIAQREADRAR
jgi:hypothetical protein